MQKAWPTAASGLLGCLILLASPIADADSAPAGWSATPGLDLESLQGTTLQVRRYELPPWKPTAKRARLPLQNASAVDIENLCIGAEPLRQKDSKQLAGGVVTIRRAYDFSSLLACGEQLPGSEQGRVTLKARERLDFELALSQLEQTGTLQLGLDIISPSLAGPQKVNLQVEVSDSPGLAWLTIFFGVVVAFLVNFFAQRWRVQQQNRQRLIQIQIELERLRATASSPLRILQLGDFSLLLAQLESANDGDGGPGLRTRIEELSRQVEAFDKAEGTQLVNAWNALSELEAQLAAASGSEDLAVSQKLETVRALLESARALLNQRLGDAADAKLKEARLLLAAVAAGNVSHHAAWPSATGAWPSARHEAQNELVCLPLSERRVNMQLHFELHLDARTPRPQSCQWDFGSGKPAQTLDKGVLTAAFLYDQPGRYLVQCTATMPAARDPNIPESLHLETPIVILPSAAQQVLLKTRGRMLWLNLGLSGVALLVASITGLSALYFGRTFGTLAQYLEAFLWGLGMDTGVRGLAAVSKALNLDPNPGS